MQIMLPFRMPITSVQQQLFSSLGQAVLPRRLHSDGGPLRTTCARHQPELDQIIEVLVHINYEEAFLAKAVSSVRLRDGKIAGRCRNIPQRLLVIAGECLPCGSGPSPAVFTYWLLKYLGMKR